MDENQAHDPRASIEPREFAARIRLAEALRESVLAGMFAAHRIARGF